MSTAATPKREVSKTRGCTLLRCSSALTNSNNAARNAIAASSAAIHPNNPARNPANLSEGNRMVRHHGLGYEVAKGRS